MTVAISEMLDNNIHTKVCALKSRLCEKKSQADLLFANITNANTAEHRIQDQLKIIYDILKKQQEDEGSLQ